MDSNLISSLFEWSYTLIVVAITAYFLRRSLKGKPLRKSEWQHWVIFGFVINLYGLSWLYTTYPIIWLRPDPSQLLGIALLHLILSVSVAGPYALVAISRHPRVAKKFLPLVFASTLVLAEMARSLIISLLYYGKGSTIAFHYTAGTIGNALSTTPLIEFAYFGGTFALTFVLGYILYCIITKNAITHYWKHCVVLLLFLLGIHVLIPVSGPSKGTVVGIVTTDFPTLKDDEEVYRQAFKKQAVLLHKVTLSFASSSPHYIVYPEDTRYLSHLNKEDLKQITALFPSTLFIDGDTTRVPQGLVNVSVFYTASSSHTILRGKSFLLPFNEYLPYLLNTLAHIFIGKDRVASFASLHTYTPIQSRKTIPFDNDRIATLICSEILSYSTIETLRNEHPDIVFYQSHLGVFHNNPWFLMHLRSFTKIAAAELRTPLISSVSGAPSFIISPYGAMLQYTRTGYSTSTYTFK